MQDTEAIIELKEEIAILKTKLDNICNKIEMLHKLVESLGNNNKAINETLAVHKAYFSIIRILMVLLISTTAGLLADALLARI